MTPSYESQLELMKVVLGKWISANIAKAANRQPALIYREIMEVSLTPPRPAPRLTRFSFQLIKETVDTKGFSTSLLFGGDGYAGRKSKGAARGGEGADLVKRMEKLEKANKARGDPSPVYSPERGGRKRGRNNRKGKKKDSDLASPSSSRAADKPGTEGKVCAKYNKGEPDPDNTGECLNKHYFRRVFPVQLQVREACLQQKGELSPG